MKLLCRARGKLNLTLDVLNKRPDGYHNISSVMQTVSLSEKITIETDTRSWELITDCNSIPTDSTNLALAAAKAFSRETGISPGGMRLEIEKRIPICAGMGGGSADAGAVLTALNGAFGDILDSQKLNELALSIGSDVPYCLQGGAALVTGRGERVEKLPDVPECWIVLCKPNFDLTAGEMYRKFDQWTPNLRPDNEAMTQALAEGNLTKVCQNMVNVFQPIVEAEHSELTDIKSELLNEKAIAVSMTGKGPTVFGVFDSLICSERAKEKLKYRFANTFVTKIE